MGFGADSASLQPEEVETLNSINTNQIRRTMPVVGLERSKRSNFPVMASEDLLKKVVNRSSTTTKVSIN